MDYVIVMRHRDGLMLKPQLPNLHGEPPKLLVRQSPFGV
jgi:hypothetical protein